MNTGLRFDLSKFSGLRLMVATNFNAIADNLGFHVAGCYLASSRGAGVDRTGMFVALVGSPAAAGLATLYNGHVPFSSGLAKDWGFSEDFVLPRIAVTTDGKTIYSGSQSFDLPVVDTTRIPVVPVWQRGK